MKTTPCARPSLPRPTSSSSLPRHARWRPGMTLIELTVVILVLLTLITVLFMSAKAWKRGSDRTLCIMNLQNVQN